MLFNECALHPPPEGGGLSAGMIKKGRIIESGWQGTQRTKRPNPETIILP